VGRACTLLQNTPKMSIALVTVSIYGRTDGGSDERFCGMYLCRDVLSPPSGVDQWWVLLQ
jgi:hypothetical protein